MKTPKVYKAHWLEYEGIYFTCEQGTVYSSEMDEEEFVKLSDHKKVITNHVAEQMSQMNEQGLLPFEQDGKWTVIYLDNGEGGLGAGVCVASFDILAHAVNFSIGLLK